MRQSDAEEIRALWKAAHQKIFLDERWLASLLKHSHTPHLQAEQEQLIEL